MNRCRGKCALELVSLFYMPKTDYSVGDRGTNIRPITIGIAIDTVNPPATKPTMIEVTVLDDWIKAVATVPTTNATIGLVANEKSSLACPPAAILNPPPINGTATNNR